MNLFASFILRAFIVILKGFLFEDGLGLAQDFIKENGRVFFHVDATVIFLQTFNLHYFKKKNYFTEKQLWM